jgi:translocation and assembly module TamB
VLGWIGLSFVGLVAVLLLVATWYTGTDGLSASRGRRGGEHAGGCDGWARGVAAPVVHLWHLAIEADGLVIHGTEAAGRDAVLVGVEDFVAAAFQYALTHLRGHGPQSRISLRYLRVEQPRFHLIVDKDGHSNAPVPKHKSTSNESVQDTLLDLQARKVELVDGLAVVNDRAIPFNVAAKDLNAEVHYEYASRTSMERRLTWRICRRSWRTSPRCSRSCT